MRTLLAGLLLSCLWPSAAFPQCAPAPDSAYFFRNLSEQRAEAKIASDRAVYEKLLTDSFESRAIDGTRQSRSDFIASELAPHPVAANRRFYSISNYVLLEHRQGHTVASYLLREGATSKRETRIVELQLRETYEVVGGSWRLAAVEISPAVEASSQAAR
jgi:hypothetical protein